MQKMLAFFSIIVAASFIFLGWQVFSTPSSLVLVIISILVLLLINKRRQQHKKNNTMILFLAIFLMIVGLASNEAFWLLMFLLLIGAIVFLPRLFGEGNHFFWQRKKYVAPQIDSNPEAETDEWQMTTNQWLGDQTIGNQVYQWHDVNLKELAGDTIIDLGNTLLPVNRENVVILQKGFGNTRILVPFGTGVYLEHATFMGDVKFSDQRHPLKNQTLQIKTPDYQKSERRIRIVTSILVGDLEVVYV